MKKSTLLIVSLATVLGTSVTARAAAAGDGDDKSVVTVAFGMGLNTALPPPNGAPNHHVLPGIIRVKQGGVVNFVVSGLHQVYVYSSGVKRDDIVIPSAGFFVNNPEVIDPVRFYYQGIKPSGGPSPYPPVSNPRSNAENRVEAVLFKESGTYLVICNVSPHLRDGMYAYVKVGGDDDDD